MMNINEKTLTKSNSITVISASRQALPTHSERVYTLYVCKNPIGKETSGKVMPAVGHADVPMLLTQMANTLGLTPGAGEINAMAEDENLYIWYDNGVCAIARIAKIGKKYARINTVFTAPDKRGHGYAGALVSSLCKKLTEMGLTPTVLADESNPIPNKMYPSLGFTPEGKIYEYLKNGVSHSENAIFNTGHYDE